MLNDDRLAEHGRSREAEWAHRQDQAALARLRATTWTEGLDADLQRMAQETGVQDVAILRTLRALGFTADSVALVFLLPAVRMAWLEGGVTRRERTAVLSMARAGGIGPGTSEYQRLETWLDAQPPAAFFADTLGVLTRILQALPADDAVELRDRVRRSCERVARRSGGFLGFGAISAEERELLRSLETAL